MTDTSTGTGTAAASSGLLDLVPTEKLAEAAQALLKAAVGRAVDTAVGKVEGLTGKLTDVAENGGVGLSSALGGGRAVMEGTNPVTGALKAGASSVTSGITDKVKGALGMGSGGGESDGSDDSGGSGGSGSSGGSGKFMNITESMDVGLPVRVAYDQWTQFADFPSFMKKVETVEQESDEKINWKAQVFWSHRSWESTIIEQIPDTHIIWRSTGAKSYADGIVSFHELSPRLTRILLVLEYHPQGFVEKTGNLWRAVGRRTRLEFKHFCRNLSMDTILTPDDERQGWRGEIRDSEVVTTHEEAMEQEQEQDPTEDTDDQTDDAADAGVEDTDTEDTDDEPADSGEDDSEDSGDERADTDDEDSDTEPADTEPADTEPADTGDEPDDTGQDTGQDTDEPTPPRNPRRRARRLGDGRTRKPAPA